MVLGYPVLGKNPALKGMHITKKQSTKPERILADLLIRNKIPFEFRKLINGREVDFLIGRVIVEVDGIHHQQRRASEVSKNEMLARLGYIPLHFSAKEMRINPKQCLKMILKVLQGI